MSLLEPIVLGGRTARNRLLFGPHVTNLGDDRAISARHVAYFERRARGGCGTIVIEEASVHPSDWPYERAPLATDCGPGWRAVADACRPPGALVIAALGHAGGQGSSAYNQRELWAPSRVPEVASREVPKWMEADDIAAVVAGFHNAARLAVASGLDGVEINAGQHSLIRQFLSGLTNHRDDEWGTDRLRFAHQVIEATRAGVTSASGASPGAVVGLRLSCDELAPWAGITPEAAVEIVRALSPLVDYLVVVRGSIFSIEKTRPDFHEPPMFNVELAQTMRAASAAPVVLQGSVVDPDAAADALARGAGDLVEMTRAQIADPDLANKLARRAAGADPAGADDGEAIRPCLRCNQTCQVRDARNPIVTCVVEPSAGHETDDPDWYAPAAQREVLVIGGGVAGMEAARVAAHRGHRVRLVERGADLGGVAATAGPARPFVAWLVTELARLGVGVRTGLTGDDTLAEAAVAEGVAVLQCTGSRPGVAGYTIDPGATVFDVADVRAGTVTLPAAGTIVLDDPIGGPIAVALAEELGPRAVLVTQDQVAGNELSRTGDLAPANVRLAQLGVTIVRRATVRSVARGHVVVRDRFSGDERRIDAVAFVDCGFRLPDDPITGVTARAGDCVAPRTVHEAVLEARRAVLDIR